MFDMWRHGCGRCGRGLAVRLAINFRGFRAEYILQRAQALAAKFIAVADKQRASQLAGVGDAFEQVDGDECLARTSGERQ